MQLRDSHSGEAAKPFLENAAADQPKLGVTEVDSPIAAPGKVKADSSDSDAIATPDHLSHHPNCKFVATYNCAFVSQFVAALSLQGCETSCTA